MKQETYNGWTNYATWRVHLEIFDGMDFTDIPMLSRYCEPDTQEVAEYFKDYVIEILDNDCDPSRLANAYANAFLQDVNWYEIAKHFTDAFTEAMQEEDREQA